MKKYLFIVLFLVFMVQLVNAASASMTLSCTVYEVPLLQEDLEPPYVWITNLWFSSDANPATLALFNGADNMVDEIWRDKRGIKIVENIGKTFWATNNQDDPDFTRVIDALKNGDPAYIWIYISVIDVETGCSLGTGYQISLSSMLGSPWEIKNLHDYNIERIGLSIDMSSHNADPNSTPGIYLAITSIFEYTPIVPEPTPFITLIVGIVGLYGFRYKCRLKDAV